MSDQSESTEPGPQLRLPGVVYPPAADLHRYIEAGLLGRQTLIEAFMDTHAQHAGLPALVGLQVPTSGHIWYDKVNFTNLDKEGMRAIRMKIGMLFQGSALFDSLTVEANIGFGLRALAAREHVRDHRRRRGHDDRLGDAEHDPPLPLQLLPPLHLHQCSRRAF